MFICFFSVFFSKCNMIFPSLLPRMVILWKMMMKERLWERRKGLGQLCFTRFSTKVDVPACWTLSYHIMTFQHTIQDRVLNMDFNDIAAYFLLFFSQTKQWMNFIEKILQSCWTLSNISGKNLALHHWSTRLYTAGTPVSGLRNVCVGLTGYNESFCRPSKLYEIWFLSV